MHPRFTSYRLLGWVAASLAIMKVRVPDLTTLAARRGGKFDGRAVENIIRGIDKTPTPAHGVETMPVWGYVFDPYYSDREVTALRMTNLTKYLESMQQW